MTPFLRGGGVTLNQPTGTTLLWDCQRLFEGPRLGAKPRRVARTSPSLAVWRAEGVADDVRLR